MTKSNAASLEVLRADVAALLFCEPAEITDDVDLFAAGVDSLAVMQLIEKWKPTADVSFTDLAQTPTLVTWHAMLTSTGCTADPTATA